MASKLARCHPRRESLTLVIETTLLTTMLSGRRNRQLQRLFWRYVPINQYSKRT